MTNGLRMAVVAGFSIAALACGEEDLTDISQVPDNQISYRLQYVNFTPEEGTDLQEIPAVVPGGAERVELTGGTFAFQGDNYSWFYTRSIGTGENVSVDTISDHGFWKVAQPDWLTLISYARLGETEAHVTGGWVSLTDPVAGYRLHFTPP